MAAPGFIVNNMQGGTQQNLVATPGITLLRLNAPASAAKRFYVWEISGSLSGPPNGTDCSVQWWLTQCDTTAAGTATTLTAEPTGGGFVAAGNTDLAVTVAKGNFTVEPTVYTAAQTLWGRACNQRGSVFWQAAPSGELFYPQTVSTGPGLRAYSATYASTAVAELKFSEI